MIPLVAELPFKQDSPEKAARKQADTFKKELQKLFVYYCDYSLDRGEIYIKQTNVIGLLKDCKLIREGVVGENELRILMSSENQISTTSYLDFQSFCNLVVKVADKWVSTERPRYIYEETTTLKGTDGERDVQ